MNEKRNFTDEDIEALVKSLRNNFFQNLGKGLVDLAWKGIVLAAVALSVYGASKGLSK